MVSRPLTDEEMVHFGLEWVEITAALAEIHDTLHNLQESVATEQRRLNRYEHQDVIPFNLVDQTKERMQELFDRLYLWEKYHERAQRYSNAIDTMHETGQHCDTSFWTGYTLQ